MTNLGESIEEVIKRTVNDVLDNVKLSPKQRVVEAQRQLILKYAKMGMTNIGKNLARL